MSATTATLADIQSDFDWDTYLRSVGPKAARIAPASCFKQAVNPPSNDFQPGQRLESRDPRNPDNTCIATVVECLGPRLRLRLDGSDDRNDFYRLVDSDDIFPHPTSRFLVPPLGFAKSSNYWPAFLEKVKSAGNFAPRACFRKPPQVPTKNVFSAGQKLEAVDRKNPLFVCPATVKEVRGDRLHVAFDGWRGAFDYWCRFDSRDLFPVGWCGRAGYPVQPPGSKDAARLPKSLPPPPPPPPPPAPQPHPSAERAPLNSSCSTSSTPGVVKQRHQLQLSKQKKKKKKSRKGSGDSGKVGRKAEASTAAPATSTAAAAGAAPATSTAAAAGTAAALKSRKALLTVFLNPAAANRQVFQVSRLRRLPGQFGPAPPSRLLQCLLQAAVSAAHDERRVYDRVPRAAEDSPVDNERRHRHYRVRARFGHRRHSRALPRAPDAREFWRLVGAFLASLDSEGLFARRPGRLVGPADSSVADDSPTTGQINDGIANVDSDEVDEAEEADEDEVDDDDGDDVQTGLAAAALPDSSQADASGGSCSVAVGVGVGDGDKSNDDDGDANVVSSSAAAPAPTAAVLSVSPPALKRVAATSTAVADSGATAESTSDQRPRQQQQPPPSKISRQHMQQPPRPVTPSTAYAAAELSVPPPLPPPLPPPPSDMTEWTSGHVDRFLRQSESNLAHLAPIFLEHDIDGKALLLLSSDMMMKYMGVKLGPALKLLNCVERTKRRLATDQKQPPASNGGGSSTAKTAQV